ncbi:DUF308 domain-containing protein [Candidatus Nephthysia bennettiae]|uniref:DUF308 domain-containing protein n=1 Tax=Candidatus Nephthysia bennettiae TaxID=3127016 RepID=A0A934N908_9BACT|nr:DUF308 domain-containing protein [Candidatus Dormibacteraeota bacterium]MBJ7611410.1 DUF308 domain-containing protein [Candidatus Dormibacteraeota bacterium]
MTENGPDEWLARIGHGWGWMLSMGVISVLIGLVALVFPGPTLLAIAILFGIQLVALGVFRFVDAIATSTRSGWLKAVNALLAVIAVVVGVYLLRHPFLSVLLLGVLLGIVWIAYGVFDLFLAAGDPRAPSRAWITAGAILSIVAGAFDLFVPGLSLLALVVALGVWLVVYRLILVVRAFHLRSAAGDARTAHRGRCHRPERPRATAPGLLFVGAQCMSHCI